MIDVAIDDLAFVAADAIARPVDAELRAITPVIRRLEQAGGEALLRQLRLHEPLEVGAAVVTGGGALSAPLVIHAVVATDDEAVSRAGVRRATLSTMQRARDFDIHHLAIAPFGLGAGNLDVEVAAREMCEVICDRLRHASAPSSITVVVENEYEAEAFRFAIARCEVTT